MNYKYSRDAAWRFLIEHNVSSLPVDVIRLCRSARIRLFTYREGAELIDRLELKAHTVGNDAFSFSRLIFFDDQTSEARQRFSIAHELGHIVLHQPTSPTVYNREISANDDPIESEANIFASRLLAPLCVLHFMNVKSAAEISELCKISMTAAQIRYERLCTVRQRDLEMQSKMGQGCFLLSPLELRVYEIFKEYVFKNKRDIIS